jgi:hypothetical protein
MDKLILPVDVLTTLAAQAFYFLTTALVLSIFVALIVQAMLDLGLGARINLVATKRWFRSRFWRVRTGPYRIWPFGRARRTFRKYLLSTRLADRVLSAVVPARSSMYRLRQDQLAAQIAAASRNALDVGLQQSRPQRDVKSFLLTMGSNTREESVLVGAMVRDATAELQPLPPAKTRRARGSAAAETSTDWATSQAAGSNYQELSVRIDRSIDEFQSSLAARWLLAEYFIQVVLIALLLGALMLIGYAGPMHLPGLMVLTSGAALLAIPMRAVIDRIVRR